MRKIKIAVVVISLGLIASAFNTLYHHVDYAQILTNNMLVDHASVSHEFKIMAYYDFIFMYRSMAFMQFILGCLGLVKTIHFHSSPSKTNTIKQDQEAEASKMIASQIG